MNNYTKDKDFENAAKEKINEFASTTEGAVRQGESKAKETIADLEKRLRQGQDQLKSAYSNVDKQLHSNPWPVVSAVAVACIFLGFMMGTSRRD
jgi:ElaB/YqjD/DUF883 family membrane-anchored ribosome-binding protein